MKALTLAAAAVAALSTQAFAGGPTVVADDPMPAAAPAPVTVHDWSGAYVGLGYGRTSGGFTVTNPDIDWGLDDGKAVSVHLGYAWQRGAMVYGAELSVANISGAYVTSFGDPFDIDRTIDLKGRLGYATGKTQFYGVLGYSRASYDEEDGSGNWNPSGLSYGLGVEAAAFNDLTVGLEYLSRDLSADDPAGSATEIDVPLDSVTLRLGFQF